MRILLVEDEEHIARGLRFNFEKEGYEVEVCDRGEPAAERLADDAAPPLDLLVLDLMLPDTTLPESRSNGFESPRFRFLGRAPAPFFPGRHAHR